MPSIKSFAVQSDTGHIYTLNLDFDDAELMGNAFTLEVVATKQPSEEPGADNTELPLEVSARIAVQPLEGKAIVTIDGLDREFEIDLAEKFDRLVEFAPEIPGADFPYRFDDAYFDWLEGTLPVLEFIPAPDPFLGCILKGGLTAGIGQAIECYGDARRMRHRQEEESREELEWWERRYEQRPPPLVRTTLRCMRKNGLRILGKAAKRAGRCIITAGLA